MTDRYGGYRARCAALAAVLAVSAAGVLCAAAPASAGAAARIAADESPDPHQLTEEEAAELDAELRQAAPAHIPQAARSTSVPVVVNVISAEDGTGNHSKATIRAQVEVLDRAFSGGFGGQDTRFGFHLREITRTADDDWFYEFAQYEPQIKEELRAGGPHVLNLYTTNLGHGVLGSSTFPQAVSRSLTDDGIVVDYRTLPGQGNPRYGLGHTATHEAGHWLGLFHTFENGCQDPGDYVGDTPYEREAASGCPLGRNTCPNRPGRDPVANFMNYSDDACMKEFTAGQADRMWQAWWAFRQTL